MKKFNILFAVIFILLLAYALFGQSKKVDEKYTFDIVITVENKNIIEATEITNAISNFILEKKYNDITVILRPQKSLLKKK